MNPLGGHIGSDGDGLGPKQPELFDIHVMIFAGDPQSTVDGLARFFAIDREAAVRLVEEVPIVVKRAAEPDVAAEMVDVLGGLGAQVVLLPAASAVPSETDLLELKVPSVPPAPAGERSEWGALESVAPPREPPRRAATVDLVAAAPMAELEPAASLPPTALQARAPARSAPPARRGVIDDDLIIAPLYDPDEAASRARTYASEANVSIPPALRDSIPPALGEPLSSAPPAAPLAAAPQNSFPDLGLGSVPPLPTLAAKAPAPPPVPNAALRGAPRTGPLPSPKPPRPQPPPAPGVVPAASQQRTLYERTLDGGAGAQLPSLGVVSPVEPRATAARPAGGDNYWSGRRAPAAAEVPELGEPAGPSAALSAQERAANHAVPAEAVRGLPARPLRSASQETKAVRTRSAARALVQVAVGVAVFLACFQQGNSILLGNADLVSITLHAFAIFAIGVGIMELKP